MLICEIGNAFKSTKKINYVSDSTLIDYELIVVDITSISKYLQSNGLPNFSRRNKNLSEYFEHKNLPLIVFAPKEYRAYIDNYGWVAANFFLPIPSFRVINESGNNLHALPNTLFTIFFEKYKDVFSYDSYFEEFEGKVILEVPYTKKVLAFYNNKSIFLPKLKSDLGAKEEEFLAELFEIAKKISSQQVKSILPDWANKYFLPDEKPLIENIQQKKEAIVKLENELNDEQIKLERFNEKKILFTGTGDELENEVEKIFRELGFEILEVDRTRDDLIVQYKNRVAVIEIKGLTGSAGEKNAAQLEKWKILYGEKSDIEPKGILIVNSFRDKEIEVRTEATFPHQMLKYTENRELCLISSLQLLGLYYDAVKNGKAEELINSLFETVGIYKGYELWKDFIETES